MVTATDWIEFVAEVAALLPELTDRQREVVRLLYYDGVSSVEAGRRLGVTKTAVLDHRDRALKKFRRKLRVG